MKSALPKPPSPRPIGSKDAATSKPGGVTKPVDAGYTGPEKRCNSCEYFDGDAKCSEGVNGGTVEWDGACTLHEAAEDPDTPEEGK